MYKGAVYYLKKNYSNSQFLPGWLDGHVYRAWPWDSTYLGWAGQRQSWNMASLPYCTVRNFHRLFLIKGMSIPSLACYNLDLRHYRHNALMLPTDDSGQYFGPRTRASSFPCRLMTRRKINKEPPRNKQVYERLELIDLVK